MDRHETKIRQCGVEDAGSLALVGSATFLESFAGMLAANAILWNCTRNHSVDAYDRYLAEPRTRAWLLEAAIGQAPVGYCLVTKPDLPTVECSPSDLELKRIYVFSRFHGSGGGQSLIETAIADASGSEAARLLLGVHVGNLRALRFYERNGFRQVGVRTFHLGDQSYDDFVLGRPL